MTDNTGSDVNLLKLHINKECGTGNIKVKEEVDYEVVIKTETDVVGGSDEYLKIDTNKLLQNATKQILNEDLETVDIKHFEGYQNIDQRITNLREIAAEECENGVNIKYSIEESVVHEEEEQESIEDDDPDYENQYEDIKEEDDEYGCEMCDHTFNSAASLQRHIVVTHKQERDSYDPLVFEWCTCCGEPVNSAHLTGDITCVSCDKRFVLKENLKRHMTIEHNEGDTYNCSECDEVFNEKQELIDHIAVHPLSKPFACTTCNKDFTRKYNLTRHLAQTGCDGATKNNFQCNVCLKEFARKDNLRDHLRSHVRKVTKKKMFICSYCEKGFQGNGLLAVHMRTHTGERPFSCDLCPKCFPTNGALTKHRRMHTGEKPFECSKCNKRFAAKESLNRHVRTHTGDKPHSCHFCGKSFIQAGQLRAHIFHHTGENAFTCPHCNRAFNRRIRLTAHIQFAHEDTSEDVSKKKTRKYIFKDNDLKKAEEEKS